MKRLLFILSFSFFVCLSPCSGQTERQDTTAAATDTLQRDFGLFSSDRILRLSLKFDIGAYMRKKPKEEYMQALLTYYTDDNDSITKEVKIKSRGISRNSICNFPPINLNLKKAGFDSTEIGGIDKIKVVTHCNAGNEVYLFKEFLIYRMFNELTNLSFRVRLAVIDYTDTRKKGRIIHSYAFLIEPLSMLNERTGTKEVDNLKLSQKFIIPEIMDRISIFNYMIGNTDWSVPGQHNIKIVSINNPSYPGLGGAVPYDFDYSGLVSTHYALPAEPLGLSSVRERRYLGACRSDMEFAARLQQFTEKKEVFYKIINEFPLLNEKEKKRMKGYLDGFYSEIERNTIILSCKRECMSGL